MVFYSEGRAADAAWDKAVSLGVERSREHEIRKGTEWLRYGAGRRKCSLGKLLDEGMTHIIAALGG